MEQFMLLLVEGGVTCQTSRQYLLFGVFTGTKTMGLANWQYSITHISCLIEYKKSSDGKVYDSFTISRDYRDVCVHDGCEKTTLATWISCPYVDLILSRNEIRYCWNKNSDKFNLYARFMKHKCNFLIIIKYHSSRFYCFPLNILQNRW